MNTQPRFHGILVATSTPFTADGSAIDEAAVRDQVDRLVAAGVHGLVPTGSTGEFSALTLDEHRRVIELFVEAAARRVPVIAGVGALSTKDAVALAVHAARVGADAIMLVPPYYDPPSFDALKVFVTAVSGPIDIPIIYYHIPGITGVQLNPGQLAELGEIKNVHGIKDTSGDAVSYTELIVSHSDKIKALNGYDTLTFSAMALGAEAVVWGAAGVVPELCVELWKVVAERGDLAAGRALWQRIWPICDFLESVNYPAGVKAGLDLIGYSAGPPRPPVLPLTDEQRARFADVLVRAGALPS